MSEHWNVVNYASFKAACTVCDTIEISAAMTVI